MRRRARRRQSAGCRNRCLACFRFCHPGSAASGFAASGSAAMSLSAAAMSACSASTSIRAMTAAGSLPAGASTGVMLDELLGVGLQPLEETVDPPDGVSAARCKAGVSACQFVRQRRGARHAGCGERLQRRGSVWRDAERLHRGQLGLIWRAAFDRGAQRCGGDGQAAPPDRRRPTAGWAAFSESAFTVLSNAAIRFASASRSLFARLPGLRLGWPPGWLPGSRLHLLPCLLLHSRSGLRSGLHWRLRSSPLRPRPARRRPSFAALWLVAAMSSRRRFKATRANRKALSFAFAPRRRDRRADAWFRCAWMVRSILSSRAAMSAPLVGAGCGAADVCGAAAARRRRSLARRDKAGEPKSGDDRGHDDSADRSRLRHDDLRRPVEAAAGSGTRLRARSVGLEIPVAACRRNPRRMAPAHPAGRLPSPSVRWSAAAGLVCCQARSSCCPQSEFERGHRIEVLSQPQGTA